MRPRMLPRLLLVGALATGTALATEATALASAPGRHATTAAEKKKKKKPTVKLASTKLGTILVNASGDTLYAYGPDGTDTSASKCTGGCAQAWPALTSKGKPVAGKGVKGSLLKVGANKQVAYGGHLLYTFAGDSGPGQTTGQGVNNFHVVGADGNPIM
jgi:predicted lipoprotein with Yx(FWY)xxD motif